MRRVIAMLLALTMVFALCACGSKELTDEEKEKIYWEVAEKKAKEAAESKGTEVVVVPSGTNQVTSKRNIDGNDLPEDLPEPLGDSRFVIEACRTKFVERDTYTQMRMEVKVRNLTEYSPPKIYIGLYYTPIDENGDALDNTINMGSTDIAYSGKAQWLEGYCDKEGATGIRILGYHIYGEVDIKDYFDEPIELYSKDYKITYDEIKGTGN